MLYVRYKHHIQLVNFRLKINFGVVKGLKSSFDYCLVIIEGQANERPTSFVSQSVRRV